MKIHFSLEHPQSAKLSCFHCLETFKVEDSHAEDIVDEHKLSEHASCPSSYPSLNPCNLCGQTFSIDKASPLHRHMLLRHPEYIVDATYSDELHNRGPELQSEDSDNYSGNEMSDKEAQSSEENISEMVKQFMQNAAKKVKTSCNTEHISGSEVASASVPAASKNWRAKLNPGKQSIRKPVRPPSLFDASKKQYSCQMCPMDQMNIDVFLAHLLFHRKKPYKCTECSAFLANDDDIVYNHWRRFHDSCQRDNKYEEVPFVPGKLWECGKCKDSFCSNEERSLHEKSNHGFEDMDTSQTCRVCEKSFRTREEWRIHRVSEHPQVAGIACSLCDESFSVTTLQGVEIFNPNTMPLRQHLKVVHDKFAGHGQAPCHYDMCEFCGQAFPLSRHSTELVSHLKEAHRITENFIFPCSLCPPSKNTFFKNKDGLQLHITYTHLTRKCVCDICGWGAKFPKFLKQHQFSKHGIRTEEMFKCSHEGCSFETPLNSSLVFHAKGHLDIRPYICRFCGKGFKFSSKLSDHEKIHLNATTKPYQCEICGNSFALRNYLYIHKRLSHQGRLFPSTLTNRTRKRKKTSLDPGEG